MKLPAIRQLPSGSWFCRLRIDGRTYDAATVRKLTALYKEALAAGPDAMENLPGTTRGHYFRGVL